MAPLQATGAIGSLREQTYAETMMNSQIIESESNVPQRVAGLQVVLVDDSVPVRERVAASVSAVQGVAAVREAGDVPSGLRLLETGRTDVVVLDIEMPGLSGLEFLEIARRQGCQALIIMLSIHDYPKLRQRCVDLGANLFFNKLTEFQKVADVCRDLCERSAGPVA